MNLSVKSFEELSVYELHAILKLRSQVFVVEQTCVYLDVDDLDLKCQHVMVKQEDQLIAYCRIIPPGLAYSKPGIGRVVVDKTYRHKKIGAKIMQTAIAEIEKRFKNQGITISAQKYLLKFYNDLGFAAYGETYLEDGIPHIKMDYITK